MRGGIERDEEDLGRRDGNRDDDAERGRLRDEIREVVDLLRDTTVPMEDVVHRLFDVMPDGWDPREVRGDWGPWLTLLLDEAQERRQP
mgnify:CR=1 FL=1